MSRNLNREAMFFDPALRSIFEMLYQRAKEEGLRIAGEDSSGEAKQQGHHSSPIGDDIMRFSIQAPALW